MNSKAMLNMSIPTIPSRYLMPNLDSDNTLNQFVEIDPNSYSKLEGLTIFMKYRYGVRI